MDDEPQIQFLYKYFISLMGFNVVGIAGDGEEAIDMFKSFSTAPDIILMDHRMPKKNGIEATKEILKISNHSKIIFTSADSSVKEEALAAGAVSFKKKPFTFEDLKSNIEQICNFNIK